MNIESDFIVERRQGWSLSKEVSLAFIFALLVQTGGMIWWAATLSAKLDNLSGQMVDYKGDRYTREDARRDLELLKQRDVEFDRRISGIESKDKK